MIDQYLIIYYTFEPSLGISSSQKYVDIRDTIEKSVGCDTYMRAISFVA